ncbi:MAG: ral secretion pathway protein [Candidatus Parcubacteria bacterium]|jgi:prepilin-type N-terminal cleavage/methylation domain-containing protein|nr:ral secretion pathway protein [Candidatus Parcubacteria bacterium]
MVTLRQRGFTLIELLVVVAIIGLLSSIVLASLNAARIKGRNSAVQQEMRQFATLLELEFDDTKSYNGLKWTWMYTPADCTNAFSSASRYVANARSICANIVSNSRALSIQSPQSNPTAQMVTYSIMVMLKDSDIYYCRGSNGASSWNVPISGPTNNPGCYNDPTL